MVAKIKKNRQDNTNKQLQDLTYISQLKTGYFYL